MPFLSSQSDYHRGVFFLMLMMLVSCANDVIAKFIGKRLDPAEVIFFRFFFSLLTLAPLILMRRGSIFKTSNLTFNILRGILGVISFYLCTYSIIHLQIVEVVTILWTIPLFLLILSKIYLKESVSITRWLATIAGFSGLSFITTYDSGVSFSFKPIYFLPAMSAFLFAVQDVMIKKVVDKEERIVMLFYFALVTSILTFPAALFVWKEPTAFEIILLILLGIFANLMQYFIFKAFGATDLSALAPFRYVEFIFSVFAGFIFFAEIPGLNVIIGAFILIPSTLYLAYSENRKSKKRI